MEKKGFVVAFAPSRALPHQNVYFVTALTGRVGGELGDLADLIAPPPQTSLDQCYELTQTMTEEAINRLHQKMNPTWTPDKATSPMMKPKRQQAKITPEKPTLWLGFDMSTFPPRNINPLKPSQMPNRSWAFNPLMWEIAGLQRHTSWTFDPSELFPSWPAWVTQCKSYFESKQIDIRNQLEKFESLASVPHTT